MRTIEVLEEEHAAIREHLEALGAAIHRAQGEVAESLEIAARLAALTVLFETVHQPKERMLTDRLSIQDIAEHPEILAWEADVEWMGAELRGLLARTRSNDPEEWADIYIRLESLVFGLRHLLQLEERVVHPVVMQNLDAHAQADLHAHLEKMAAGELRSRLMARSTRAAVQ